MTPLFQRASNMAVGSVTRVFADRPWRSKTMQAALFVVLVGMGFWLKGAIHGDPANPSAAGFHFSRPIPGYVRLAVSYIGGFLIGWTFRRFVAITFLITLALLALLGLGKSAGCDFSAVREKISQQTHAVRETAEHERDYLRGLLPSSTAAGLGVFWGFWRRSRGLPGVVASNQTTLPEANDPNQPAPPKLP